MLREHRDRQSTARAAWVRVASTAVRCSPGGTAAPCTPPRSPAGSSGWSGKPTSRRSELTLQPVAVAADLMSAREDRRVSTGQKSLKALLLRSGGSLVLSALVLSGLGPAGVSAAQSSPAGGDVVSILSLSNRADLLSAGDALLEVQLPADRAALARHRHARPRSASRPETQRLNIARPAQPCPQGGDSLTTSRQHDDHCSSATASFRGSTSSTNPSPSSSSNAAVNTPGRPARGCLAAVLGTRRGGYCPTSAREPGPIRSTWVGDWTAPGCRPPRAASPASTRPERHSVR
jgi:hypothetical protein